MSREHLTEQQSEQDTGASVAAANGDIQGLPPNLYGKIMSLKRGDAEGLKLLLDLHHEMSDKILQVASPHVGASAVRQAIAMRQQNRVGKPGQVPKQSFEAGGEFELESGPKPAQEADAAPAPDQSAGGNASVGSSPPTHEPESRGHVTPVNEEAHAGVKQIAGDAFDPKVPGTPLLPPKPADPQWVVAARKYNQLHPTTVAEFNDLTNNTCAPDDLQQAAPLAVAAWQQKHGLEADGKVGPHTLAKARQVIAKVPHQGGASPEARIPV
jgi:murein L,D-transpeptidase YcbB/YkuD